MSTTNFANGTSLVSSANTPDTLAAIFQPLITQILGTDPSIDPNSTVRIGWPQGGQPAWGINDDVCIIRATPVDDAYSRVRDSLYAPNNGTSATQKMSFTQVWTLHLVFYGPNGFDRARLIDSAMSLDWVHDALAARNLYGIVKYNRPMYAPEIFQGQWWKRTDLRVQFNELVTETTTADTAAGVDVTILTDTGITEEFVIGQTS